MTSNSTISAALLSRIAADLALAAERRAPIEPPSAAHPELTVADAYAIQELNVQRSAAAGDPVVGHKVGLTSAAMQQQLGVDQPDFGVITGSMVVESGDVLDLRALIAPRVEAEFAFRIGADLPASPSPDEVLAAVDGVAVALEIIDSRVVDWRIDLVDTVADNASSARIVCGPMRDATRDLLDGLPDVVVALDRDGTQIGAGPGSAVLGDPMSAVHWLASAIGAFGRSFRAGDVVLAGAVAASVPLEPGVRFCARADGFGPAEFTTDAGK